MGWAPQARGHGLQRHHCGECEVVAGCIPRAGRGGVAPASRCRRAALSILPQSSSVDTWSMRVRRDELRKFNRAVAPAPAPIEPRLSAFDEARLIAEGDASDPDVRARRARTL